MSSNAPASSKGHKGSPILLIILGVAILFFWLIATMLQIMTSEAFIMHGSMVTFTPNWSVFWQPVDLAEGHISPEMTKAVIWGWVCELAFLVCVVGYEICHDSVLGANRKLAPWFRTGVLILIAFDAYTDFLYGTLASGFWGQIAFAAAMCFAVMFFGVIGVRMIEHACQNWNK